MDDWLFKESSVLDGFTESTWLAGGKVQWIVIEENITEESFVHGPNYPFSLTISFGSTLLATALLAAILVLFFICRQGNRRQPIASVFLHFTLVQVATVLLFIPVHFDVQHYGRWRAGPFGCRTWLLGRVLLSALSNWSALGLTIDRLLHAVRPRFYNAYMTQTRATLLILLTWLAALVTILPMATSMWHRRYEADEFILEEVCAINLTRTLAIGLSAAQFFIPAFLLLFCILLAAVDAAQTRLTRSLKCYIYDSVNPSQTVNTADDITKTQSTDIRSSIAIVLANLSLFIWCLPFYSLGLKASLCVAGAPCVPPTLWLSAQWLSFVSCTVTPLVWLIDLQIRKGDEQEQEIEDPKISHVTGKDGTKYSRINSSVDHVRKA